MSIKISSVLALCSSMAIAAPAIWNGSADVSWYVSSAQAYNLTTAEQLAGLAKLVNQGTSSFEGKTITLGADIFLNDTTGAGAGTWASTPHTEWVPIGTSSRPFKGEFDGIAGKKNRKIYGLYVSDATKDYVGLFGYTSNVKISNLDVLVGRITAKDNVGALVGYAAGGSVTNVHSEVKVTGNNHVGGLVGYFTGTLSTSSVNENVAGQDSVGGLVGVTTGSVSGTAKAKSYFVGNVAGRISVGGIVGAGSSISLSYADGIVKGDSSYVGGVAGSATGNIDFTYHIGGDVSGASYVGGIAGYVTGNIDSTYHIGGDVSGASYVGGVVGQTTSSVKKSYSEGNVTGTSSYVGGLVGYGSSVASSRHTKGDVNGTGYVGGLIGRASSVTNSYSEGNVTGTIYVGGLVGFAGGAITSSYHIGGDVSGKLYVGGLAGEAFGAITSSYSKSLVTASGSYVGGLAGRTSKAVTGSYSVGNITGKGYVGGAVGYAAHNVADISKTYADGLVKGDSSFVGGVVGYASGAIDSAYHIGGDVSGTEYVGGLTGKTISSVINSYSEGNVTGTSRYVGGLIGYGKSIDSSYHTNGEVSGLSYVGGLIGMASSTVKNSYSEGDVTGTGDYVGGLIGNGVSVDSSNHAKGNVGGANYIGGLIGNASSTVKNSYSEGDVAGTSDYVGGLVGNGVFVDSSNHAKGNVSGTNYIGGLIGYASSGVKNSYSEGDVAGTGNYVGGLIGMSYYRSSGSSDITITTVQNSHATGNVEGKRYVGGLIGLDSIYMSSNYGQTLVKEIFNAYSVGNVLGTGNYVGGVIGKSDYGHNSSSNIKISLPIFASYHKGSVEGASSYVGGVAGFARGSVSSSHHTDGDVSGTNYIGGLIGWASSVTNSYSEGDVAGTGNYVGGVAGFAGGSVSSSHHTDGDVSGTNYIGGLIGWASSVTNSYSEGNVSGSSSYVGGVAGSSGKIRNSYAEAKYVRGRNNVGGLAGYVADSIDVSYFEGDSVTGINKIGGLVGRANKAVDSSYSTANVKGDDEVGGLVGSAYGDVSNSYAIGNVVGDVEHSSAGNDNLGGLVGYQYGGSVSKSMALGNVSGTTKLGGLVGRFDGTKISQSYANGNVTGDYYGDPADEVGNYYIGGLVGYAKGTLTENYASGVVKGIEDEPVYTGCVVGYVNGSLSVSKSYYDKTKCGLGVDGGEETATVSGSPAKTTAEMQVQETFVDWDFTNTWKIMEGTYPFLQIYSNSLTNAVVTTASLEGIEYDGSAKTPLVTSVTLFGEALEYETEYTITYKDNINAGMATINVCGVKPYGGCKVVDFEIVGIAIDPTIVAIDNMTYTGHALTPEIKVYNGTTLLAATDYIVEYADNLNAGTASVTVTLKGNYSGSATKTFTIKKATPVISQNPTASNVVNGQTLASSELTGGSADVEGAFVWQVPETVPTLENDGYIAVFVPTDTLNYDSVETTVPVEVLDYVYVAVHVGDETLDSTVIIRGGNYTLPNVPDSVGYDFVGFYKGNAIVGNPGDMIVLNENTVIEAIYEAKTFAITFANGNVVLQSENTAYGTLPEYRGETPTKTATAQYTYTFKGWNPAIASVTGAATYTAVFDSTVKKYTVTFMDGETVLQSGEVAYGTVPTAPAVTLPENTAQYSYSFGGWDSEVVAVTGPATYTAVINRTLNKYEVVFKDYDGTVLKAAVEYDYGTSADNVVKPSDPTQESTAQYTYTFKGWNPSIADVTEAAVYTAEYDSTVRSYEIAFVNGSSTLQSGAVEYGQTPVYTGDIPTKTATVQYTYTFKGWTPTIASVTGEATYAAVFDSVVNRYLITFKNGSEVIQVDSIAYGTVPEKPSITLPMNTAQYTYSLSWDKDIVAVTGEATYTATIDSAVNKYDVVFKDYDGTVLKDSIYTYGTLASKIVEPANLTRAATAKYTFAFKGWSPSVADVTTDAAYTAVYDSTIRSYTIAFVNGSETEQSSEVEYGEMPFYKGSTPTKTATMGYTYTFKGWSPAVTSVSGAATYTAVFDSTIRKYTVTFMNDDVEMQTSSVAYGLTPVYSGKTPTKAASDSCTYKFSGWSSDLKPVTGDVIYTAKFEVVKKTFVVHFVDEKSNYQVMYVAYGDTPKYTGNTPTKNATNSYTYEFVGWSPKLGPVTKETYYTAVFDSAKVTGIQDVRLASLNILVSAVSRNIQISAAPVGSTYAIFDMQGRVLRKGRVESPNFSIMMPQAGTCFVKIGNYVQRIDVK